MKARVKSTWVKIWRISYSEWSETRKFVIAIAFQLCFRICHQEGPRRSGRTGTLILCWWC